MKHKILLTKILRILALWRFRLFWNLISLLILNNFLTHRLIRMLIFIRIDKLIELNIILKWHLLSIIELTWWFLEIEKWTKFLLCSLSWSWLLFAWCIYLKSSVSWTFSSFCHSWLNLLLLKWINLFINSLLVLLLLNLRIGLLLLLLLMAQLSSML